jgi:hypothetical protein
VYTRVLRTVKDRDENVKDDDACMYVCMYVWCQKVLFNTAFLHQLRTLTSNHSMMLFDEHCSFFAFRVEDFPKYTYYYYHKIDSEILLRVTFCASKNNSILTNYTFIL